MKLSASRVGLSLCLAASFTALSRAQDGFNLTPTTTPTLAITTTTHYLPSTTFNLMTSSAMSTPTDTAPPQLFPPAADSDSDSDDPDRNETVFNYYFLFLAAFGALVAVLLWWLHRQRRRRKQQQRLGGQHALARDLQGWTGARRFIHGRYTPYQTAAQTRREEGLDEHGEAPPPYQHKTYIPSDTLPSPRALAIPLRTISRDNNHLVQPPGYSVR